METSTTIVKISAALLAAQKSIGGAKKGATNPFFGKKYADLGAVMEACKDHLNENGITVLQPIMEAIVKTILLHESGEWISSSTPIVTTKQNDPQALGSAITYARRYGLQSMVFIPAEDDDGERAMTRGVPVKSPTPAKAPLMLMTDMQRKKIYAMAAEIDPTSPDKPVEKLKEHFSLESLNDMTIMQAKSTIDSWEKKLKGEVVEEPRGTIQ